MVTESKVPADKVSLLKDWVKDVLISIGVAIPEDSWWQPLKGDAGFRQYFRIKTNPSMIAVYAPVETEDSNAFIAIGEFLRSHSVATPEIKARDLERGFLLLEDLGENTYFDHLADDTVESLYKSALGSLLKIQLSPKNGDIFPSYDALKLQTEMRLFSEWFVPQLLGYSLSDAENDMLEGIYEKIIELVIQQPQVIVHRDYHSQNIMYGPGARAGIVDFQDAVIGPVTYDLVSLLRDCYVIWPRTDVERWALAYARKASDAGIFDAPNDETFIKWFDWMGLQRHIKVLGIFARLSIRDNKHKYLGDLPLVIHYFRSVAGRYNEFSAFVSWFDEKLMPLIQAQSWMNNAPFEEV